MTSHPVEDSDSSMKSLQIEEKSINTIRLLSADMVQKANSGHPGMPMGMASIGYLIFKEFLKINPSNPEWLNRDRFVLSAGHGSALLYSLLHLSGYEVSLEDLESFRQINSRTPGHPEYGHTAGVETTTGPLGQGFATSVGMALGQKHLASVYNTQTCPLFDYTVYGICGDGDLMEGISTEAASLAGHLKCGNLIYFYDSNRITIEGSTELAFSENVALKFEALGWQVLEVKDIQDLNSVREAHARAKRERDKPSLIICHTEIGFGSPNKQGKASSHGAPLGEDELALVKEAFGFPAGKAFYVPEDVRKHFAADGDRFAAYENSWNEKYASYCQDNPEKAEQLQRSCSYGLPAGFETMIPDFSTEKAYATRQASSLVFNAFADRFPYLIGGSADLSPSCGTHLKGKGDLSAEDYSARNIHYGVREHAMGAIMNGLALSPGIRPLGSTFLIFSDYMKHSIRLSALMKLPVIYVFTHDSIGVGEDGPTHQPVEQLTGLRAIPNLAVIRPADANETLCAISNVLEEAKGPVALVLSRQALPTLDTEQYPVKDGVKRGAYILSDSDTEPELILLATGSEVSLALEAQAILAEKDVAVRVVSAPCLEVFEAQTQEYQQSVLPGYIKKRLSIEAGSSSCWYRWVGLDGICLGIDEFGKSGPAKQVQEHFGITTAMIVSRSLDLVE